MLVEFEVALLEVAFFYGTRGVHGAEVESLQLLGLVVVEEPVKSFVDVGV